MKQLVLLLRKNFLCVLSSVVCPPGTFSPPTNRQCSPCPMGTYSMIYGRAFCTHCKDGMITQGLGARSTTDCMKEERTKQGTSICCWSRAGRGLGGSVQGRQCSGTPEQMPRYVGHGNFY